MRGGESNRVRGAHPGSDRVLALSEAFHHIFVALCTPALQSPHSKLLLLLCVLLCMLLVQLVLLVPLLIPPHGKSANQHSENQLKAVEKKEAKKIPI